MQFGFHDAWPWHVSSTSSTDEGRRCHYWRAESLRRRENVLFSPLCTSESATVDMSIVCSDGSKETGFILDNCIPFGGDKDDAESNSSSVSSASGFTPRAVLPITKAGSTKMVKRMSLRSPLLYTRLYLLRAESVQRSSLSLQRIHDVQCHHRLAPRVFRVRNRVPNHWLEEHLQHIPRLFIDQTRDTLHTTTTRQTTDGRLRNALDVIPQNLAMAFRTSLSQSFSSFTASWHSACVFGC